MKNDTDKSKTAPIKYAVAEGIAWINGKKVDDLGFVTLSKEEALYDLALGRIYLPEEKPSPEGKSSSGKASKK